MPEPFQPLDQRMTHPISVDFVEVIGTEFAVLFFPFQQVIGDDQQLMGHRDDGSLGSAPGRYPPVKGSQVVVLLGGYGPTCLG